MSKVVYVVISGTIVTHPGIEYEDKYKYVSRVFDSEDKAEKYIRERMTGMYGGLRLRNARSSKVTYTSTYPKSGLYAYIDEFRDDGCTVRHYYEWLYQLLE